jgi:hypothetical protein
MRMVIYLAPKILNRWKNYFSIIKLHRISDVRQIEIHTAEPLVPDLVLFGFKLLLQSEKYKQIPAELIQAGGETLRSEIHKHINFIWNKEELSDKWEEYIIIPVYKKDDKTDCNNYGWISQKFIQYSFL